MSRMKVDGVALVVMMVQHGNETDETNLILEGVSVRRRIRN